MNGFKDHKKESEKRKTSFKEDELRANEKWRPLVESYVKNGNIGGLRDLIHDFKDKKILLWVTKDGQTCLHLACRYQNFGMVKLMLESEDVLQDKRQMVEATTNQGLTPMHFVVMFYKKSLAEDGISSNNSVEHDREKHEAAYQIIHLLKTNRADVNAEDNDKLQPLHYAAIRDSTCATRALLDAGCEREPLDLLNMTPLMTACVHGSTAVLEVLIREHCRLDGADSMGNTVVHLAAKHGHVKVLDTLLQADPSLVKDRLRRERKEFSESAANIDDSKTPLELAVENNHLPMISRLLELMTVDCPIGILFDTEGGIPHNAAEKGCLEALETLHAHGFPLDAYNRRGETAIHAAAAANQAPIITYILDNVNGDDDEVLDNRDIDEMTPLLRAASGENAEAAEVLLDRGADFEAQDKEQRNFVYIAASNNNQKFLEVVLNKLKTSPPQVKRKVSKEDTKGEEIGFHASKRWVDLERLVNSPDLENRTSLHQAADHGHLEVCKILKNYGARLGELNDSNETALHLAAKNNRLSVVNFLLEWIHESPKGMSLPEKLLFRQRAVTTTNQIDWLKGLMKAIDSEGNTALHLAAKNGHEQVCKVLLAQGADVKLTNMSKRTPLDLACENGHLSAVKTLVENGSDVNGIPSCSKYPLLLAAEQGKHKVVEYLIAHENINITVTDATKSDDRDLPEQNAIEMAINGGHRKVVKALLSHKDWEKLLHRSNVMEHALHNVERITPMRKIIKKYPDLALMVMDKCITETNVGKELQSKTYNFEFIEDTFMMPAKNDPKKQENKGKHEKHRQQLTILDEKERRWYNEAGNVRPEALPYNKNNDIILKEHPLSLIAACYSVDENPLLEHELVVTMLDRKWTGFGRYIYLLTIFIYLIYLLSFTAFLILVPPGYNVTISEEPIRTLWDVMGEKKTNWTLVPNDTTSFWIDECGRMESKYTTLTRLLKWLVILLSIAQLVKEFYQMYCRALAYISAENAMELFIYVSTLLVMHDFTFCTMHTGVREPWQWVLACAASFLAWINLFLFIRKLPRLGIFVLMFFNVFKTFLKFAVIFILFNLAFATSFFFLMQNRIEFSSIPRSILKTLAMQIGELEFTSIFYPDDPDDHEHKLYVAELTFPLFMIFCIVMTILLMNLLVGLAVDNINDVQKKAEIKRLRMMVELVLEIDRSLPFIKSRSIKANYTVFTNPKKRSIWRRIADYLGPAGSGSVTSMALKDVDEGDDMTQIKKKLTKQKAMLRELDTNLSTLKTSLDTLINKLNAPKEG